MWNRLDDFRMFLDRGQDRLVPATLYIGRGMEPEPGALDQLADATRLDREAIVIGTPDLHIGYGVPIGCVLASPNLVSPAAVGYDINCGMRLLTTGVPASEADVKALVQAIRRRIPLGEGRDNIRIEGKALTSILEKGISGLAGCVPSGIPGLHPDSIVMAAASDLPVIEDSGSLPGRAASLPDRALKRGMSQFGTLGGGNHFIEIQRVSRIDDPVVAAGLGIFAGQLLVMIHSGSRGLGHETGGHYMRLAAEAGPRYGVPSPGRALSAVPIDSREGRDYMAAMNCAANFAYANRFFMAEFVKAAIVEVLGRDAFPKTLYDVSHNIARMESHGMKGRDRVYCVHRKGSTRAFPGRLMAGTPFEATGQPVLIPGSMGTASYLLSGCESGVESLFSVNHGAGRLMSRTAAAGRRSWGRKKKSPGEGAISDEEFRRAMKGVVLVCDDPGSIKAEAPQAYKDIDAITSTVVGAGLATTVARMIPLGVLKG